MSKNIDTDICPECMEEPCVCGGNHINEAWKIEAIPSHKIGVTVSDPKHTMVSKRSEQIQKRVIVKSHTKEGAVEKAKEFYKKRGYKVHDAFHHSIMPATSMKVDEAMDPREKELLTVTSGTRSAKLTQASRDAYEKGDSERSRRAHALAMKAAERYRKKPENAEKARERTMSGAADYYKSKKPGEYVGDSFEPHTGNILDEVSDEKLKSYVKGAMHDTITGKKDRNPGMKKAFNRLAGLNKPLVKEEVKQTLQQWADAHEKQGHKITKNNKNATYHAWDGTKHLDSYQSVREEVEQIDELKASTVKSYLDKRATGLNYEPTGFPTHAPFKNKPTKQQSKKYAQGMMGAMKRMNIAKANEEVEYEYESITEAVKTTHEDPLVTVHDKHGLHTHANLSVANGIFNTNVKHTDVHKGPVKTQDGHETKRDLVFAISKHHATEMKNDKQPVKEESDPPFDKPYTKVTRKPVVDKSGAKHGPMSFAKHLAQRGAQQASGSTSKGTYHTITKPDIRNPNGPGKKIKVFVPVKEQARAIDDSPETGLNLGKVKTFSKFDKVTATSRPVPRNHNEETNIDTSLLELYLKLSDENKIHMMEMFDNGMKDLLVDFISKESE